MQPPPIQLLSRIERFPVVGSTNDVVREWLAAGTPEVCLAVADAQTAGRGREGRSWQAPPGGALLLSLGFRPTWLRPQDAWRLAAIVSLAMAEAAEAVAELPAGAIRLKWPNDLVVVDRLVVRKVAGVLGETDGLGGPDPRAVVGIGTNVDWSATDFPAEIAARMTSLREAAHGRRISNDELLDAFLALLEGEVEDLRRGFFDADAWVGRQVTHGRPVVIDLGSGRSQHAVAVGTDPASGGLVVESDGQRRVVFAGEIHHLRLAEPEPSQPTGVGV